MNTRAQVLDRAYTRLKKFVHDYEGLPLEVLLLGGGTLALNLPLIPGCSRVLLSTCQLYSSKVQEEMAGGAREVSSVSPRWLWDVLGLSGYYSCPQIACSAALTTNRWRMGQEHAWLYWSGSRPALGTLARDVELHPSKWVHLEFQKPSQAEFEELSEAERELRRLEQEYVLLCVLLLMAELGNDLSSSALDALLSELSASCQVSGEFHDGLRVLD